VGLKAGLDTEAREKTLSPLPGIEPQSPGRSVRSQDTILTELPRLLNMLYSNIELNGKMVQKGE
jgi:hypothetical protein